MKSHFRLCTWGKIAVLFLGLLIPSAVWAGDAEHKHSQDQALFSSSEYIEHLGYLASDELEGRGTGQEGNDKAADYIAQYFAQCGLQPAGDNGTFFQQFPLKLKNDLGPDCRLAIGTQQRRARQPLRIHEDYMPYSFSKAGSFKGEVVFVGYGVASDQLGYDDFADVDVSGKVVLMLRRAPKFTEFSARDMSFRSKTSRANARDVAAILVANSAEDDQDDKLPEFNIPSRGPFGFGRASFGVPLLQIKRAVADRMLTAAGLPDLATLEKQIEDTKKPASQVLPGVTIKGAVDIRPVETMVRNVVGVIPGTGNHADQFIALGAHYDHLGVQNKGESTFNPAKDIFNGADDNASGTAMVMTMAKAYTHGVKPDHSMLLMTFTGEELGLIGSRYYVDHPTVDRDKIMIMLNFDMVGRLKDNSVEVIGARKAGYAGLLAALAKPYELELKLSDELDFGGSDHASFLSKNIPAMFFFTGLHPQYHHATDDTELINSDGAMRIAKLAADCIDDIDAGTPLPPAPPAPPEEKKPEVVLQLRPADQPEDAQARGPRRVMLGITGEPDQAPGALIGSVVKDSAAERAGMQKGDRIIKLGDTGIKSFEDLVKALAGFHPGDRTTAVVKRGDQELKLDVQFGGGEPRAAADPREKVAHDVALSIASALRRLGEPAQGKVTVTIGDKSAEVDLADAAKPGDPADHDRAADPFGSLASIITESAAGAGGDKPLKISVKIDAKAHETSLNLEFECVVQPEPKDSKGK